MKKGFTIIELMVSILAIGILLTLGFQGYNILIQKAQVQSTIDQYKQIKLAMAAYYKDTGSYPIDLKYLIEKPQNGDTHYDAIAYALGDPETEDAIVRERWGGPYLHQMDIIENSCLENSVSGIKPEIGNVICFGASHDGGDFGGTNSLGNSNSNGEHYNVIRHIGLNADMVKEIFSEVNGRELSSNNLATLNQIENSDENDNPENNTATNMHKTDNIFVRAGSTDVLYKYRETY